MRVIDIVAAILGLLIGVSAGIWTFKPFVKPQQHVQAYCATGEMFTYRSFTGKVKAPAFLPCKDLKHDQFI